ncbi:MAG: DinB superfamily protein [Idiomarinaceae bacterium HL-53]|nr:MAG: DinB superfamily protein [Idiomarinaceae bacterium HL-53]CUS47955.1 DinB family protein [Idiomarinaceae bacterium HL-53]
MASAQREVKEASCPLVAENLNQLSGLLSILNKLTAQDYTRNDFYAGSSAIASHVRHVLNHYELWLRAQTSMLLNYEKRERDIPAEKCLDAAKSWLQNLLEQLQEREFDLHAELKVSECGGALSVVSTVGREMAFLYSHTAHHLALIKQQANELGYELSANLGVHPSTLRAQGKACAQ